jgi:RNA polymerase sigma factor (sigma-70 family)
MSITVDLDAEFSAWFDEVLPRVLRLTRRTTSSAVEAEDIASEALARAYAGWPKIRSLPYRDGWVLRTASNLAIDIARRRSRFPWRKLQFAQERASGTARSVEDTVADRGALAVAMAKLPTRQREAVSLRYLSGLSLDETAAVMGLGTETVRTHVSRGLAALRTSLGPVIGDESEGAAKPAGAGQKPNGGEGKTSGAADKAGKGAENTNTTSGNAGPADDDEKASAAAETAGADEKTQAAEESASGEMTDVG